MDSAWVLDANIAVWAVTDTPYTEQANALIEAASWIVVPTLWVAEVTSSLHKVFAARGVPQEEARQILEDVLRIPDHIERETPELAWAAYQWADRLGQLAAYDGFYVALAERLGLTLWTADRSLYRQARKAGASFVRCFPDDWKQTS